MLARCSSNNVAGAGSLQQTVRCKGTRCPSRPRMVQAQAHRRLFYNRVEELTTLSQLLDSEPSSITVLTGPSNTGLTAILRELIDRRGDGTQGRGKQQVILQLNGRGFVTFQADGWARKLYDEAESQGVEPFAVNLFSLLGRTLQRISGINPKPQKPSNATTSLERVIELLEEWLDSRPWPPYPVIIIDFANCLRRLEGSDDKALQAILKFLVRVSDMRECHVILSTTDSFFTNWLEQKGLKASEYNRLQIGDLTEEEIKGFVYGATETKWPGWLHLSKSDDGSDEDFTLPESLWQEGYQVWGGNIHRWRRGMNQAMVNHHVFKQDSLETSWREAFKESKFWVAQGIRRAFDPIIISPGYNKSPQWTPQQWVEVLKAIKEAPPPYHAVSYDQLCDRVGAAAVNSLLDYNYITYRTRSALAKDLPQSVFDDLGVENVVVANAPDQLAYILAKKFDKEV